VPSVVTLRILRTHASDASAIADSARVLKPFRAFSLSAAIAAAAAAATRLSL